jgi:Protein of unknown function (DUF4199)
MKKLIIRYGMISGLMISLFMILSLALFFKDGCGDESSMYYGFGTMLVSLSLIYFAIRRFRNEKPENYKYSSALLIGLGISLICSLMYVITWEIAFNNFVPDFMDKYAAFYIQGLEKDGMAAAEIAIEKAKMDEQVVMYQKTWYRMGITFTEIFPMGLLVSLVAPIFVRKKK